MSENDTIDWGELGETRWRELAAAAGASELQLRFAVMRFGGASAARAAKAAGYKGTKESLRRAGYEAVRSTAVQNLLELAAINAPEDARVSPKEVDAKVAKLVRSSDPNVSIKAIELHTKREAARKAQTEDEWEGPDATIATFLQFFGDARGAVVASLLGWYWTSVPIGERAYFLDPLLADMAPHVAAEFPDVWKRLVSDARDEWQHEVISGLANRPRKPIAQIVAEAKERGHVTAGHPKTNGATAEAEAANAAQ